MIIGKCKKILSFISYDEKHILVKILQIVYSEIVYFYISEKMFTPLDNAINDNVGVDNIRSDLILSCSNSKKLFHIRYISFVFRSYCTKCLW